MTAAVGYVGLAFLVASYFAPLQRLLALQLAATACLLAYAVLLGALPYILVQVACALAIAVRLIKGRAR